VEDTVKRHEHDAESVAPPPVETSVTSTDDHRPAAPAGTATR
jgi:hypothetical protein